MPTTYEKATEAQPYLDSMLNKYHRNLKEEGVTFDLVFAYAEKDENGDPKGPAVKHGGYAAAATVRIIGLKDRAKGMADAEILIDGDNWDDLNKSRREALIDHELEHLTLVGKRDDLSRPRLKMRMHDHQFGWFDIVAKRHGENSYEVTQFQNFKASQSYFLFAQEEAAVA